MFKKTYLAVDVGNENIKAVWGYYKSPCIYILEYGIIKTPINTVVDGKIINPGGLSNILKEFIKKNKINTKSLIMNITGTGVITREINIPNSSDDEIKQILKYDAQQYFPVDIDNYVQDYKVLEEISNEDVSNVRVLLVAVPIKQAEEYMKLTSIMKMKMEAIDIPANSISKLLFGIGNSIIHKEVIGYSEFAVIDIGADTTGVYIFNNKKLSFNRILLNGSRELDKLISNELEIDLNSACELKKTNARIFNEEDEPIESSNETQICNIIKPAVNNMITDINRLFEFYNSRNIHSKIQKIYICGGGSKLYGLSNYISSYFNIPVEPLIILSNVEYKGRKKREEYIMDFDYLINAIGGIVRCSSKK